jgi:CHAT domain-containing protein/tetratricopeptide (TPR) repeat protein
MKMIVPMRQLTAVLILCSVFGAPAGAVAQGGSRRAVADPEEEVLRLLEQAQKLKEAGGYGEAVPLVERALSLSRRSLGAEHPGTAMALNRLATLRQAQGDLTSAETLFRQSLAIYEKALGPDDLAVGQSLSNLALLYADKGDYKQAEALYRRAILIGEKALGPAHPEVAFLLTNLGELYRLAGAYDSAEQLSQQALTISEKALGPQNPQLGIFLNNLATVFRAKGDYVRAEALMQRALRLYQGAFGAAHPNVATMLNNLGAVYVQKGDYVRAELLSRQSLAIKEKALGAEHPALAPALNALASIYYARGEHARSEPLYRRAFEIRAKSLGPEHPDVATSLNNLAAGYLAGGDYVRAGPLYEQALGINEKALGPDHPAVALTLNNLAFVYRDKGEFARAETLYKRAVAVAEQSLGPEHPDTATYLHNLANLYRVWGRAALAVPLMARANDIRERHLTHLMTAGSEEQKLGYLATLAGETDAVLTLHTRSAPDSPEAARVALLTVLRRKGRVLDAVAESISSLRRRLDPQGRALLERLAATRSQLAALVLQSLGKADPAQRRAQIEKLLVEADRLEAEISSRSAEYRTQAQPVTLERVQSALPPGAALLELFSYRPYEPRAKAGERSGAERYVAYVLKREGAPAMVELGDRALIDAEAARLRAALVDPKRGDVKQAARALDEMIMRPVRRLLGEGRAVFVSPDGMLNLIPFGALVGEDERYLAENYSFTYLTSGRDLLRLGAQAPSRQPPVVLANPLYEQPQAAGAEGPATAGPEPGARRSADLTRARFAPLPGTAGEAEAVSAALPSPNVLTGARAAEAALKQVSGPAILHVATHGFFLPDQPQAPEPGARGLGLAADGDVPALQRAVLSENPLLRSGIALAGANRLQGGDGEDGILTALEASALDLWGTKLVVLSACETGVGQAENGEGVYGLRRALVLAGSESQVMSLWQVSDEATRDLMVGYYKRLQAGEGRTEALRLAQLEMLKGDGQAGGGPQRGLGDQLGGAAKAGRSHPYFWAAFIQSGDWRPMNAQPPAAR